MPGQKVKKKKKKYIYIWFKLAGIFLVVQWLRLCTSTARDMGSIPGWGTKILQAVRAWPHKQTKIPQNSLASLPLKSFKKILTKTQKDPHHRASSSIPWPLGLFSSHPGLLAVCEHIQHLVPPHLCTGGTLCPDPLGCMHSSFLSPSRLYQRPPSLCLLYLHYFKQPMPLLLASFSFLLWHVLATLHFSVDYLPAGRSVMSAVCDPHGLQPARLLCPLDSPGENTGVGCHSLLQGIFPTQGSKLGLLHCRQILYLPGGRISVCFVSLLCH